MPWCTDNIDFPALIIKKKKEGSNESVTKLTLDTTTGSMVWLHVWMEEVDGVSVNVDEGRGLPCPFLSSVTSVY